MGLSNPGASSPIKRTISFSSGNSENVTENATSVTIEEDVPLPPMRTVILENGKKVVKVDNIKSFMSDFNGGSIKAIKKSKGDYAGTADYYEPYDPDAVAQSGHSVVTTETLPVEALCFLCGSASSGQEPEEEMLLCKSCCEPYHPFCLNPEELPQTSEGQINWVCRKCIQCQICGRNEGDRMRCSKCTNAYHGLCLQPSQQKLIAQQTATSVSDWKCSHCLRCASCNVANVAHFDEENGAPLCDQCCLQKKKGSFCPLCEGCYDDNDYEARMMECDTCGGWIHAKCEGVDAEKYQILSYLPNTIDFVCKCKVPVPKSSKSFMEASSLLQAVNVVTAGLVEDQPSPMHTKEFQTLSEFQSVNLDHETATAAGLVNIDDSEIVIQYVDVPTDIQPIVEEMSQ